MYRRRYNGRVRPKRITWRRYRGQRAGGFVIHSRRNIRPYRAPLSYRQIARRPIPRSRIVNRRYRMTNNPFGDRIQYKFKFSFGGTLTAPGGTSFFTTNTLRFIDLADAETRFGSCPGFIDYARLFKIYRVTGCKVRFTPIWNDVGAGGAGVVPCAFIQAWRFTDASDTPPDPAVASLPEQRWSVWRPLNNWEAGGNTKGMKLYVTPTKVCGPDITVPTQSTFVGVTNETSPFYSTPTAGNTALMRYGVFSMGGTTIPAGSYGSYLVTVTYYTTMWGRRNNLQD